MAGSNMGQVRPDSGPGGGGRRLSPSVAECSMQAEGVHIRPSSRGFSSSRIILHVDVNSAFLAWEAVWRLQHGDTCDLRDIPSVISGDEDARKGIVLARSLPAKRCGVQTGEPLWQARRKCPGLVVAPPDQALYLASSDAMYRLLSTYSPRIERYSIDECFLELDGEPCLRAQSPESVATEILERIRCELGFTVNIGVSVNKLLAKSASELEKPHRVHTLFPHEIPHKFWTLPVRELFLVGPRVAPRLFRLNIFSIGHLAHADPWLLERHLGRLGPLLWQFANGLDDAPVTAGSAVPKNIGNSVSTPYDVEDEREALLFLRSVTETAAGRLRAAGLMARVVAIGLRNAHLQCASHQCSLPVPCDNTSALCDTASNLFRTLWDRQPLRHLAVSFSSLSDDGYLQETFLDGIAPPEARRLDDSIDALRAQFGKTALMRGGFVGSGIPPMAGGPQDSSGRAIPSPHGVIRHAARKEQP